MPALSQRQRQLNAKKQYSTSKKHSRPVSAPVVKATIDKVMVKTEPTNEIRFDPSQSFMTDTLANSFQATDLTNITQGTQVNQRLGDHIYMCGLKAKLTYCNNLGRGRLMRVMIVRDLRPAGFTLNTSTWANLYRGQGSGTVPATRYATDAVCVLNHIQLKILYDKVINIPAADFQQRYTKDIDLKLSEHVKYNFADAGDITPENGKIWFICHLCEPNNVYSGGAPANDAVVFDSFIRVFFKTDLHPKLN